MKKILHLLILVVTITTTCYAQISKFNESEIKKYLQDSIKKLDPIEGIYNVSLTHKSRFMQSGFGNYDERFSNLYTYRCAIIHHRGNYRYVLLTEDSYIGAKEVKFTRVGETLIYNVRLKYELGEDKEERNINCRITLESLNHFQMSANNYRETIGSGWILHYYSDDEYDFIKEYPTSSMYEAATEETKPNAWSGSGFAIGNGYIVTNSHVASDAKNITIKGVKGDMNTGYSAEIVANDKINDLAILRINDPQFKGFGAIPYMVGTRMSDVGEDVFVLGYPLTQALGNEIKLTNGIISSRTGYQGDVSTYQISAPVQPGNSGGPMFDSKGNVLGIVVAGVPGAENVGYAIKTSYLKILIESAGLNIKFPANNTISTLSLAEKVKRVKNFVFYIECSK